MNTVYKLPLSEAQNNNSMLIYTASLNENIRCKEAMEKAIADNYNGSTLNKAGAAEIVYEFGIERTTFVLAASVCNKEYDGRFSRYNKEWAKENFPVDEIPNKETLQYCVDSHPAVLNGFIELVRDEIEKLIKEQKALELQQPENDDITITCVWSESTVFEDKTTYSVYRFDELMKKADTERYSTKKERIAQYGSHESWEAADEDEYYAYIGYDKVRFTVNLPNGINFTERQDIGDGFGGVIDFLKTIPAYSRYIPMLEAQREKDKENIHEEITQDNSTNSFGLSEPQDFEEDCEDEFEM